MTLKDFWVLILLPNIEPTTFNVLPTVILLLKTVPDVVHNIDWFVELGILNVVDVVVNNIDGKVELGILNVVVDVVNNIDGTVAFNAVNKLHVKFPLTFNDDKHVIGCDICLTTTYDEEVDVIPFGVGCNPKSPYEGVKNPTVFIVRLFDESNAKAPL